MLCEHRSSFCLPTLCEKRLIVPSFLLRSTTARLILVSSPFVLLLSRLDVRSRLTTFSLTDAHPGCSSSRAQESRCALVLGLSESALLRVELTSLSSSPHRLISVQSSPRIDSTSSPSSRTVSICLVSRLYLSLRGSERAELRPPPRRRQHQEREGTQETPHLAKARSLGEGSR